MQHKQIDYKFFFTIALLVIFGMVMISSVSVFSSYVISGWATNQHFFIRNVIHIIVSSILLVAFLKIPYEFIKKIAPLILAWWIALLLIVLAFWSEYYWAKWWLKIPWVPFVLQPTEFVKLGLIIFLAYFFWKWQSRLKTFKYWFLPFAWILWVHVLLIWMQPDFWTLLVILPVSTIMFFVAGWNVRHLFIMLWLWFVLMSSVYFMWSYDKSAWESKPAFWYVYDRVNSFLWNEEDKEKSDTVLYQQDQSLIAIWRGWFSGEWFGSSIQKYWYLPQVEWDFIFAVTVEELWFIWWMGLIFMYLFIWWRGLRVYNSSSDPFVKLYALWFTMWIMSQAFINIWVNLKILPNTWITLPFVSYWGSSLLALMIWAWIFLAVSRDADVSRAPSRRTKVWESNSVYMFK